MGEFPSSGWDDLQQGAGMYATCRGCNSFGGRAYVPAYSDFVAGASAGLVSWGQSVEDGPPPPRIRLRADRVRPGAVIRQVLFMLLVASGSSGLGDRFPVLRSFVLDQRVGTLPSNLRVYLSFVVTSRIRINSTQIRLNLVTGANVAMVEVAGPPFAWLLEIGDDSSSESQDVSDWTKFPPDYQGRVDVETVLGSVVNPFVGDYRHVWQIEADAS